MRKFLIGVAAGVLTLALDALILMVVLPSLGVHPSYRACLGIVVVAFTLSKHAGHSLVRVERRD